MSGSQEYPAGGFFGAASAPLPVPMPLSQQDSPQCAYPWGPVAHTYTPVDANRLGPNGAPTLYGHENGAQPHPQGMLSRVLKRIISDRMRSDNSEIVGFKKEQCGPNRVRVTVTFESDGL